jgi:LmbE family N-acetylglucosaminyl deacetylase
VRGLSLDLSATRPATVLVLGAHSDDIEIGAGGTLRWLLEWAPQVSIQWIVFAAAGQREAEATASAASILGGGSQHKIRTFEFRDGFFPYDGARVKEAFEELKKSSAVPDVILTHHKDDLDQDHKVVADLTWNTFRNHLILEYEVPKYDGGLSTPNVFVPLTEAVVDAKVEGLMKYFGSQRSKRWFSEETFRGLMRLRGVECQSESGYAEGFHSRKLVWSPPGI